ncbi:NAD(P)/FAD-dependent oxidoreductase [Carboxylicivirga sp. M1479]|uniref:NAD(P)/FAD-dependent oxidoreductase n=1 Tax=Carboxylicivirga sp. M1479 TaxID=2594476 RepID=UPI00117783BB|nr:FAD-binding protein [Carboxylicivirga sp. M1479]TRX64327.1 FAD-binding protein [Carboxylicivirga sp. M1479]
MKREIVLRISPKEAADDKLVKDLVAKKMKVAPEKITYLRVAKRSIDARKKIVLVQLHIEAYANIKPPKPVAVSFEYPDVKNKPEVIVVGAGPGGYFAALRLVELGLRPIVLERGKGVNERKKDLALLNRNESVNEESNYAFGEGGAGTFSDGKLYTRSTKRGDFKKILEVFQFHGANDDILVDAHPHIGTDKLPEVIKAMRQSIIDAGGEVHFDTKVSDLIIEDEHVKGVVLHSGEKIMAQSVILATGHSARDIYYMLDDKKVLLEAKTWAMGVRVEHPQELIDQIQYHSPKGRGDYLPAATYSLSCQIEERGVYSFCMCPGGFIVPAMTGKDEMVVNGMSPSKRNSPWANSGMVVEVRPEDIGEFQNKGVLGGLEYQMEIERLAFVNGGRGVVAPAQSLADFVDGQLSFDLPECSYVPGLVASPLHFWLPENIGMRLRKGLDYFDRRAHGFVTNEALVVGVESRTSSPVRIPRDRASFQHLQIKGLYPCGEGAGYAGGIASSAIDGEKCAEKTWEFITGKSLQ